MFKKFIFLFIFFSFFLIISSSPSFAAKKRTNKTLISPKTQNKNTVPVQGIKAWVRFRPDRKAILINFSGFENLQAGSYELTYTANGVGQGAGGTILLGDTNTKTLLFGTCSANVCTYHQNITNAQLKITSILKSGLKVVKTYRLKV